MAEVELDENVAKRINNPPVTDLKPCVVSETLSSSPGTSSNQSEERILVLIVLAPIVAAALVHHKQRSTLADLKCISQRYFYDIWISADLSDGGPDFQD